METIRITAQPRNETGKGPNSRLRRSGRIPVVLYGLSAELVMLSLDRHEFQRSTSKVGDEMVMFDLHAPEAGIDKQMTVIRDVQRDPVTEEILHMDLLRLDMNKAVDVEVAIHGTGTPAGLELGGVLEQIGRSVRLRCLPMLIPSHITVDVSQLMIGQSLHVSDLRLAEGVEILTGADEVLFHVIVPRQIKEPKPAEAVEGAEGEAEAAEGEKAEGAGAGGEGAEKKGAAERKTEKKGGE